jgi:thymidylate synthase ThyX
MTLHSDAAKGDIMTIEADIIADSVSAEGKRITTMQLRYPRFIHAEFMTHRVFSRNASSSRAIPVERMIADLRRDPAKPVFWGSNKPGMQAGEEVTGTARAIVEREWLYGMERAIQVAQQLMAAGLHKQIANRVLEPWAHINVVVTATEWDNFFALRRHADAQPEIKVLADAMWDTMQASIPEKMEEGEWHLPYITVAEKWQLVNMPDGVEFGRKISAARCARVSYLTHDGKRTSAEEDLALFDRLMGAAPLHASPAEHQAMADTRSERFSAEGGEVGSDWDNPHEHGNFIGWRQHRRMLPGGIV